MQGLFYAYLYLAPINILAALVSVCALIGALHYTRKTVSKFRYLTAAILYIVFNFFAWAVVYIILSVLFPSAVGFNSNLSKDLGRVAFVVNELVSYFLSLISGGWVFPVALVWWERRKLSLINNQVR